MGLYGECESYFTHVSSRIDNFNFDWLAIYFNRCVVFLLCKSLQSLVQFLHIITGFKQDIKTKVMKTL